MLDSFTGASSWFWTYSLEPASDDSLAWGNETGKEFVPLVQLKSILPDWHPNSSCTFDEDDDKPTCTVDMLVDVLEVPGVP